MLKQPKKISEETAHQNQWWSYKHDVFEDSEGKKSDYYYGEARGSTLVIPILPDGRVVMVSRFRYLADGRQLEFVRGNMHDGETPLDAAKRELREELGCEAVEMVNIGVFRPLVSHWKDTCHVFLVDIDAISTPTSDEEENLEAVIHRSDEIDERARTNSITDGMTLAAWAMARSHFIQTDNK
ncbi:MAG: NUDIX hydrolase [Patescibacteria group bacterium]